MQPPSPHPWILEITQKAESEAPKFLPRTGLPPTHAVLGKALDGEMTVVGFAHVAAWMGTDGALTHVHFKGSAKVEILKLTRSRLLPLKHASKVGQVATLSDEDRLEFQSAAGKP